MRGSGSDDGSPVVPRRNPFATGMLLGLTAAVAVHGFQWNSQSKLSHLDWPAHTGWPQTFWVHGGFSAVSDFHYLPFLADVLIWLAFSFLLGLLIRWFPEIKLKITATRSSLMKILHRYPFCTGWAFGMLSGIGFHLYQWHEQTILAVDDWVAEIGWPVMFWEYGGFLGLDLFHVGPFLVDVLVWSLISLLPGWLLRFFMGWTIDSSSASDYGNRL